MFVLIGELKGDYDDYYERPTEALACSASKEELVQYSRAIDMEYVDYRIEEVPLLDGADDSACRHDSFGGCIRPEPWDGKEGSLFRVGQGWVCVRCKRPVVTERQARLVDEGR